MRRKGRKIGERRSGIGGRQPVNNEYFSPHDSNTIDDITGFKTKFSKVKKTWDGWYTEPDTWYYRNPQDFPVTAQRQKIYPHARSEQALVPPPGSEDYHPNDYSMVDYSGKLEII